MPVYFFNKPAAFGATIGLFTAMMAWPTTAPVASVVATPRDCTLPLRVTLTFLSSQAPTASSRGSNTYRVDWQPIGTVPGGDGGPKAQKSTFNYRVTVVDPLGTASINVVGDRSTANVVVERSRTTPLTSITAFATVEGKADLKSCNNAITFDPQQGASEASSPTCAVPMRFSQNPSVVSIDRTLQNGIRSPIGFGVKTDWAALVDASPNCLSLVGFEIQISVRFPDGGQRTASESVGPETRSRVTEVSNSPLIANKPTIQQVTIRATTSLTLSGTSPH